MSLNFFEIFFRIAIIYALIATGSILRRLSSDPDNSPAIKYLNKIILDFFFPFLVISSIVTVSFNSLFIVVLSVLFAIVIVFSGLTAVFLYSRFRKIPNTILGSMFISVSFPNSVFLPFPLILILIGPEGLISATLFAVTIILFQNSIGSYLALSYGEAVDSSSKLDLPSLFKKIFFFPPTLAMFIGFILKILSNSYSFDNMVSSLHVSQAFFSLVLDGFNWAALILALILVGLTFNVSFSSLRNRFLFETSFIRLVIAPISGFLFLILIYVLFPAEPVLPIYVIPIMIQAFSGPAIINIAFAKEFGLDVETESTYITIITLLSLFFLPLLVILSFTLL